jgi:O-antigen/teichoic acid export membrane protein
MRRNTLLLLFARLASAGTTLVVLALIGRLRGAEALGVVGVGFAAGAIAATLSDLGISLLLVREVSRRPAEGRTMLGAAIVLRLVTVPLVLAGVYVAGQAIAPAAPLTVLLAAAGLIGQQMAELTRSMFMAHLRMTVSSAHGIVENVAWLAVIAYGLLAGMPLETVFFLGLLVWLASVVVGFILVWRLLGVLPAWPGLGRFREIVALAGPFGAFSVVGIAYARIDPLLIGLLVSGQALAAAGAYFGATRLLAAFEYLPEAVSRAAFPELARRAADRGATIEPILRSAAVALLAIGLVVPVVLIPAGAWLMGVVYGPDAADHGWLLGALSVVVPVRYLAYLYGVTLTSADAQGRRVAAAAGALVAVLLIDAIGLPRIGLLAPVLSAYVAAAVIVGIYAFFVQRRFATIGLHTGRAAALGVAALLAVGAGLVVGTVYPPVVAAVVSGIVYVVAAIGGPARPDLLGVVRSAEA